MSLLDLAQALAIAFVVAAVSMKLTGALKAQVSSKIIQSIFANPFVLITFLSVGITTLFHRWTDKIQGAEDLGMYLLYLFFFVIGLKADLVVVVSKVPILFAFCLVMAMTNLVFTLPEDWPNGDSIDSGRTLVIVANNEFTAQASAVFTYRQSSAANLDAPAVATDQPG